MSVPANIMSGTGGVGPALTPISLSTDTSTELDPIDITASPIEDDDPLSPIALGTNTTPQSVGAVSTDASSTSNLGGLGTVLGDLGSVASGVGSLLSSPLGQLGQYVGLYDVLANQVNATQGQNAALAGQITQIGAPDVAAGNTLTGAYTAGELTQPFQQQLTATQQANQQAATSQTQQVAQLLANSGGGQNVQGALSSESQQIQNQQNLANTQAMAQAFSGELTAGLDLTSTGGQYVQSGIQTEIQSNTALQQQLSQIMGTLAQAYALSSGLSSGGLSGLGGSGSGAAGTGTGGAGVGSLFNSLGNYLNNSSFNAGQAALGAQTDSALGGVINAGNQATDTALDSDAAAGSAALSSNASDVSDLIESTDSSGLDNLASDLGDLGFSSAGGQAADLTGETLSDADVTSAVNDAATSAYSAANSAVDAATVADTSASAVSSAGSVLGGLGGALGLVGDLQNTSNPVSDYSAVQSGVTIAADVNTLAGGSAATTAGLSTAAGALGALAIPLGIAALGYESAPYTLPAGYWSNLASEIQGGPTNPNFDSAFTEAISQPQSEVPVNIQELVWDSGMEPVGEWGLGGSGYGAATGTRPQQLPS